MAKKVATKAVKKTAVKKTAVKTVAKKKSSGTSAFMKPVQPSEALAIIVGDGPMPRTQITKKLWDYIKKNKLQSKEDKRKIIPDAKLSKVLGSSPIDMFKMNAKISKHLSDPALAKAR